MVNLNDDQTLARTLQSRGMNRKRSLAEYNEQLGLDIVRLARESVGSKGQFLWYDLCCGYFLARDDFLDKADSIVDRVDIYGVDLDARIEGVIHKNVVNFPISPESDLVTCLQGMDYIQTYLRQGAESIQNWYNCLREGSILAFDVAKNHVQIKGVDIAVYLKDTLGDDVKIFPTPEREKSHNTLNINVQNQSLKLPLNKGIY